MIEVEQFVMAYQGDWDRIKAIVPEDFISLRPVLRINGKIQKAHDGSESAYLEFNTPVEAYGKRGWLNIANWHSPHIAYTKSENTTTFFRDFIEIKYMGVGVEGGCPAEKDNDGCFFIGDSIDFVPAEKINTHKEFCDCAFQWKFNSNCAKGISIGEKTMPAQICESKHQYPKIPFTAENAAEIEYIKILGSYRVSYTMRDK